MDASGGRTPPVDRVAEIRAEIEAARSRIAGTLEALRFKTDLPARLGDSMGNAAATFTAHVMDRMTSAESDGALGEDATVLRVGSESDGSQDEGEP
jgi:Protein of unknown function (DUF3618)